MANSDPNPQFGWIMNGKMVRSFTLKTAENGTFSPILLILVNTNASIFFAGNVQDNVQKMPSYFYMCQNTNNTC